MIKSFEVINYKSIKKQKINFKDVNILIGANNSGKSNVLEGLFTLQTLFLREVEESFSSGPYSFGATFCRDSPFREGMYFGIKGTIKSDDFDYYIKINSRRSNSGYKPYISEELLEWNGEPFAGEKDSASIIKSSKFNDEENPRSILKSNFKLRKYQFTPKVIKKDHQIEDYEIDYDDGYIPQLKHDGQNLLDILYYVREYDGDRYSTIITQCQRFFPNLVNLKVQVGTDSNSVLQITMKSGKNNWNFIGPQLSDGFVIILSIITLLSSKKIPNIILLEELENGLNPASIEKILDIMFEVAKEKNVQFLITTHSPMFLELMRNNPESVIICEQDEFGLSQYISLSEKLTMFKDDYEEGDSLIDLWFSGLIGGL
jgi:AAA15 family ATPase/GTPase